MLGYEDRYQVAMFADCIYSIEYSRIFGHLGDTWLKGVVPKV